MCHCPPSDIEASLKLYRTLEDEEEEESSEQNQAAAAAAEDSHHDDVMPTSSSLSLSASPALVLELLKNQLQHHQQHDDISNNAVDSDNDGKEWHYQHIRSHPFYNRTHDLHLKRYSTEDVMSDYVKSVI